MNREQAIKSAFHALLAGIALWEISQSKTAFRKACCTAWCGFHASLAYFDYKGEE